MMKRYELHCHTKYSKCSNQEPKKILELAKQKGLDGIAITDHNTIKGALEIKKLNKNKKFEVIVSEEVDTNLGDVLVYYVKKAIKPGKFEDVVKEAHKQGGIVVIAHPYGLFYLRRFKGDIGKLKKDIDAVEAFNGRTTQFFNKKSLALAEKNGLAITGGSDAHFNFEFSKVNTVFEGNLRDAIKNRKTKVKVLSKKIGLFWIGIGHFYTFLRKRLRVI